MATSRASHRDRRMTFIAFLLRVPAITRVMVRAPTWI